MTIYKRGNTYWLNVKGSDGRQIRRSTKTADRKAALQQELELRIQLGKAVPVFDIPDASKNPAVSFERLADEFLKHQSALGRRSVVSFFGVYVRELQSWFKDAALSAIDHRTVERYRADRLARTSIATANRSIAVLRRMLTLAVRWGYLDKNPVLGLDPIKEGRRTYRVLTPKEQAAYLAACRPDFRVFAWLALRTGMRRGELQGLRVGNVDTWRSLVSLPQSKAGQARHIPIHSSVKELLEALLRGKMPTDFALLDQRGNPWTHTVLRRWHQNAVRRAGLQAFRFHDLRHTHASDLLASGAPMHIVQAVLGHADMRTTAIYAHLNQADVHAALAAYGQYLGNYITPSSTIAGLLDGREK